MFFLAVHTTSSTLIKLHWQVLQFHGSCMGNLTTYTGVHVYVYATYQRVLSYVVAVLVHGHYGGIFHVVTANTCRCMSR